MRRVVARRHDAAASSSSSVWPITILPAAAAAVCLAAAAADAVRPAWIAAVVAIFGVCATRVGRLYTHNARFVRLIERGGDAWFSMKVPLLLLVGVGGVVIELSESAVSLNADGVIAACTEQGLGAFVTWAGRASCVDCYTYTAPHCNTVRHRFNSNLYGCATGHMWSGAPCITDPYRHCLTTALFRNYRACVLDSACYWTGRYCTVMH